MPDLKPPFSVPFDLAGLPDRGAELVLSPDAAERARIASWLDVLDIERLDANVRLTHLGSNLYGYHATFAADVVQACVVTLEPVPSQLSREFSRQYRVIDRVAARRREHDLTIEVADADEPPEDLTTPILDLAAPVLEELSLALDPYPRAPGVTFEPPKEEQATADSPFAVLAKLKQSPPGPAEKPQSRRKGAGKRKA